jgi:hypothetical protein
VRKFDGKATESIEEGDSFWPVGWVVHQKVEPAKLFQCHGIFIRRAYLHIQVMKPFILSKTTMKPNIMVPSSIVTENSQNRNHSFDSPEFQVIGPVRPEDE